jgi:hypothetical protein
MATKKKRKPTHWRRSVGWTRLGPDGAPADDGLTKLGAGRWEPAAPSEEGAVATASRARIEREERQRHPIDLLMANARDVLRAVDALAEADLEGPGAPALWDFASKSSAPHAPAVLAARALCAAIRSREAIARGDAAEAARHAYFAAHHWQTRNQKRQEPERRSGLRRPKDGSKGGEVRARNERQRSDKIFARWVELRTTHNAAACHRKVSEEFSTPKRSLKPKTVYNLVAKRLREAAQHENPPE